MAYYRKLNAVLLAKIEASEGVEETPSASTDAVLVENVQPSASVNLITTNEVTGSLDGRGEIVGGMRMGLTFDVYMKGSGAAGTAPEFGKLLRACGWAETVTATAVPSSAEACQAGGSTTVARLGTSASSTADLYNGMPIIITGTGAGNSFIVDYGGSTNKEATLADTMGAAIDTGSNYQIPVNVLYKPASASIPSLTFYYYEDGVLWKIVGARGTFTYSLTSGGVGKFSFNFTGMFVSKTDAAVPTPTYDASRPPVFSNATAKLQRAAVGINTLSFDCGNELTNPDNPNALEGFDPSQITRRMIKGSIDPSATLMATRAIITDFRAGNKKIQHYRWGATAGNRVGIVIPETLYTEYTPGDRNGISTEGVGFSATGQDSGAYICFY